MMTYAFTANALLVTAAVVLLSWLTSKGARTVFVSWNQAKVD